MARSIEQRWQRAQAFIAQRMPAPARAELEMLQAEAPGDARTHLLAAQIAWRDDRVRAATREALAAAAAAPDDPSLLLQIAGWLVRSGEAVVARECLARPSLAGAAQPDWLVRMADLRQQLNQNTESLALLERALAVDAGNPDTRYHYGAQLYFHGRLDEATVALKASLAVRPGLGHAAFTLAALRTATADANHLPLFAAGLQDVVRGSLEYAALQFARYKELEDLGRDEDAWQALVEANAAMHACLPFRADQMALPGLIADACPAGVLNVAGSPSPGPQPIFVMGFPRSGTTLLDRMLGSHDEVRSAGELPDVEAQLRYMTDTRNLASAKAIVAMPALDTAELGRRYLAQTQWRAGGRRFYVDKWPANWKFAGLIHAALPGARLVHLVRDPLAVCFSNWRALLGDGYRYSYDMTALGTYHRAYRRLMAHWHRAFPGAILDVAYADLVHDPEATLRRVFDFCGLPFQPGCVEMRGNDVAVMTLSAGQVRERVNTRSIGRWRRYAQHLQPLRDALQDSAAANREG